MGYVLEARYIPSGKRSYFHNIQTGSGAQPAYYTMGTEALPPGKKWQKREACTKETDKSLAL
jgi:hypothetical protein